MALSAGVTKNVLARLSKGQPVSMSSMEKICNYLDCDIGDVMGVVKDKADIYFFASELPIIFVMRMLYYIRKDGQRDECNPKSTDV